MKNPVGPVLRMGDEVEQVIAAIEDDNPDTEIEVIDRGAYIRVQGEDEISCPRSAAGWSTPATPSPGRAWLCTRPMPKTEPRSKTGPRTRR
jgi:hypothetical protein